MHLLTVGRWRLHAFVYAEERMQCKVVMSFTTVSMNRKQEIALAQEVACQSTGRSQLSEGQSAPPQAPMLRGVPSISHPTTHPLPVRRGREGVASSDGKPRKVGCSRGYCLLKSHVLRMQIALCNRSGAYTIGNTESHVASDDLYCRNGKLCGFYS